MKNFIKIILAIVVCSFLPNQTQADVSGIEITYECTSTPNIYKIKAKIFRDCNGLQLCPECSPYTTFTCQLNIKIRGINGTNFVNYGNQNINVTNISNVQDKVGYCNYAKSYCSNCLTRTPGTFNPGIEQYTFEGLINLSTIPTQVCTVMLGASFYPRNNGNTSIISNNNSYHSEAVLNRCITPCASSPTFTNDPLINVTNNRTVNYNAGVYDADGDSISYGLGLSYTDFNTPATYNSSYSAQTPFPYLGFPNQSPPLTPPAGININQINGNIIFRPNNTFLSNFVLEIKKWRKINNVNTIIGTVKRDIELHS